MIKKLLLLLSLALPLWAGAETIDPRIAKADVCGRYELFHINGVDTDFEGATDNLIMLRTTYGNAYDSHIITYGLAYNATRGAPIDLIDAFGQVIRGYPGATFRDWIRAVVFGMYNSVMTADVAAAIAKGVAAIFDINRPPVYGEADVYSIESAIRTRHSANARVLLVPHSQGVIYANLVRDRLVAVGGPRTPIPSQSIGIIGVAAPRAVYGGLYLTSVNDRAINGVRFVFPDTPAANITIPVNSVDLYGHSFRDIYLALAPTPFNNLVSLAFSRLLSTRQDDGPVYAPPNAWLYSLSWRDSLPAGPRMLYTPPSVPRGREEPASFEEARAKAVENAHLCIPLIVEWERRRLLRIPIPWDDYFAVGCWTNLESLLQAWNIHSSDGTPEVSAIWDDYYGRWRTRAAYTCRSPS